jgi:hypothetical protein
MNFVENLKRSRILFAASYYRLAGGGYDSGELAVI